MGLNKEQVVNGLKTLAQDFWAIGNKEEWKALPARVEGVNQFSQTKKPMEKTKVLSRRDFLKLTGTAAVAEVLLSACAIPVIEVGRGLTATPKKEGGSEVYPGLLYQKTSGVFKIEEGQGVRAVLNGFEFISKDQDLTVLPFGGVKYGQGESNGLRDASGLKAILPGFDGGLVVNDSKGTPVSGLVSVSKELFVLTRMEIPNDNLLTMFKLDSGEKKVINDDGSYVVTKSASMIQRGVNKNTGKLEWAYSVINKELVKIPVLFEYDKQGNFKGYSVSTINILNGPTPTPEQQAAVVVKNIAFMPKDQSFVVEKPTPTPAPTATQEATATAQPTPENKVGTIIFERKTSVDGNAFNLMNNDPKNKLRIGTFYTSLNSERKINGGSIVVLPKRIYRGFGKNANRFFCECYIDESTLSTIEVGAVNIFNGFQVLTVPESDYGKLAIDEDRFASINVRPSNLPIDGVITANVIRRGLLNGDFLSKDIAIGLDK